MTKREILVELARRFEDAQNVLGGRGDGDGGRLPLMPRTWNRSFREFERSLRVLRSREPVLYRHFHARYLDPWPMRMRLKFRRTPGGLEPLVPRGARFEVAAGAVKVGERSDVFRVLCWAEWVDEGLVGRALDELEREFRGQPFLPDEFVAA